MPPRNGVVLIYSPKQKLGQPNWPEFHGAAISISGCPLAWKSECKLALALKECRRVLLQSAESKFFGLRREWLRAMAAVPEKDRDDWLRGGCRLQVGEALDFSHIYTFDRVFSPLTMRALARLLRSSPWYAHALAARRACTTATADGMGLHGRAPHQSSAVIRDRYVFISFRQPAEWWGYGLHVAQPVAKLRVQTTGKEGLTCWIYINTRKLPYM